MPCRTSSIVIIFMFSSLCLADNFLCDGPSGGVSCSNETLTSQFIELLLHGEDATSTRAMVLPRSWFRTFYSWFLEYEAWILSVLGSMMVGLSGIFPLLVIPIEEGANLKTGAAASLLRVLLSFAVGGLLCDVFLHLLPEAWAAQRAAMLEHSTSGGSMRPNLNSGLWVLAGILLFTVLEMVCSEGADEQEDELSCAQCVQQAAPVVQSTVSSDKSTSKLNGSTKILQQQAVTKQANGSVNNRSYKDRTSDNSNHKKTGCQLNGFREQKPKNGFVKMNGQKNSHSNQDEVDLHKGKSRIGVENGEQVLENTEGRSPPPKQVTGYLNLLANSIDNFMHGLAVGGGFLVSFKMGALTTLAILIHEVPHEIGDFAILLRAGFSRWDAAKAQLYTAGSGLLGALTAVAYSTANVEARTAWVVPFTAGGFLHIALVTVLPELLSEVDAWESAKQLVGLMTGMCVMGVLTVYFH